MAFDIAYHTISADVANGGVFEMPYPSGRTEADFAAAGHRIWVRQRMATYFDVLDDFTLSFGASAITVTWGGGYTLKTGYSLTIQLERGVLSSDDLLFRVGALELNNRGTAVNVLRFGANRHEDVANFDNTKFIQRAISSGENIAFPRGTFMHEGLTGRAGLVMAGQGPRTILYLADGANNYGLRVDNANGGHYADFIYDGNKDNQTGNRSGLYTVDCHNFTFERVVVRRAKGSGFYPSAGGGDPSETTGFRYYSCVAEENGIPDGPAYTGFAGNGNDFIFVGCRSSGNEGGGFKQTGRNIHYFGCRAHDNERSGFSNDFNTQNQGTTFHYGSISENNGNYGFYFSSYTEHVELHGISATGNGRSGVYVLNSVKLVKFYGGDIRNNGQNGLANDNHGITFRLTFDAGTGDMIVNGTTITDDQDTKTQQYGINITAGVGDLHVTGAADLRGNALGAVYTDSSETTIRLDPGVRGLSQAHDSLSLTSATGTTDETDLASLTIKAREINTRGGFKVTAWGNTVGTAGAKQVRFYIGATSYLAVNTTNAGDWLLEAEYYAVGSTAMRGFIRIKTGGADTGTEESVTVDTREDFVVKITGQVADAADSVTRRFWRVERLNPL
jgi:hypothetical protein